MALSPEFAKQWPISPDGLFVHITGPRGVGKTVLAVTTGASPDRMIVMDGEASAVTLHSQLCFKEYHNLVPEVASVYGDGTTDIQYYLYVLDLMNNLTAGEQDVIVFDNILRFENGLVAYVTKNITNYGISTSQSNKMPALKWGPIKNTYQEIIVKWMSKAGMLIVTTPIGQDWVGGRPSGTYSPKGKDVLEWLTGLRIWLKFSRGSRAPIGLVLKDRITRISIDSTTGKADIIPVLPRRIEPCTWERIKEYMAEPSDHLHPASKEKLSDDEWAILNGILPAGKLLQLEVLKMELKAEAEGAKTSREKNQPEVTKEPAPESTLLFDGDVDKLFDAALSIGVNIEEIFVLAGTSNLEEVDWTELWAKIVSTAVLKESEDSV